MKSEKLLKDFYEYCVLHPEQTFWQAVCNWSGTELILAENGHGDRFDTFYWEGKDG